MITADPRPASARRAAGEASAGGREPAPRGPLDPAAITLPTTHSVDLDLQP